LIECLVDGNMPKKLLLLFIITIFLSSCGFQLKGFRDVKNEGYSNINVSVLSSPRNNDGRILASLKQRIKSFDFKYVNQIKDSDYYVEIIDAKYNKEIQTKSSTGLVKQYLLKFNVRYVIYKHTSKDSFDIVKPMGTIYLQTDYTYEPQNILGSDSEEKIIADNLRKEASGKILNVLTQVIDNQK
tara:strand:- start:55513 stop:56067 length:555 start_codon:yes stop_codon:yes gene_type:complete